MSSDKTDDKNCKLCDKTLSGEMIFYPEICIFCVIDLSGNLEGQRKLAKYEKSK